MYTFMYLQLTFITECSVTHITYVQMFPSMNTVMYVQITLVLECGFFLVCVFRCTSRLLCLLKDLLHTSQEYGNSPVCKR